MRFKNEGFNEEPVTNVAHYLSKLDNDIIAKAWGRCGITKLDMYGELVTRSVISKVSMIAIPRRRSFKIGMVNAQALKLELSWLFSGISRNTNPNFKTSLMGIIAAEWDFVTELCGETGLVILDCSRSHVLSCGRSSVEAFFSGCNWGKTANSPDTPSTTSFTVVICGRCVDIDRQSPALCDMHQT